MPLWWWMSGMMGIFIIVTLVILYFKSSKYQVFEGGKGFKKEWSMKW